MAISFLAGPTGFEPAISSVTGRRDNHFTTSPRRNAKTDYVTPTTAKATVAELRLWSIAPHNFVNASLVSEIVSGKVHLGGSKLPRNRGNDSKSYQEMQRLNRDKAAGF